MFAQLYFHLTAYFPRRLPRNIEEHCRMKETMMKYYGVEDKPEVWMTIAGQVTSTPPTKLRRSWGHMANVAKRLSINKFAHEQGQIARDAYNKPLQEELARKMKEIAEQTPEEPKEVQLELG